MSFIRGRTFDPRNSIAGAAVAHLDPNSRDVSATCWASSQDANAAAARWFGLAARDLEEPVDAAVMFVELRAELETQTVTAEMVMLADEIESHSRLLFHRSTAEQAATPPTRHTSQHVAIVIPFRSSSDTPLRTANLRAVVGALERQQLPRDQYSIILVEEAAETTVPDDLASEVDTFIRLPYTGPFNKALALNTGVAAAPSDAVLCLLDGDIAPDEHFVARNASRVATQPDEAHLPYSDMFCLLPEDSAAIRRGEQPGDSARSGYVITHPPGGCVFLTAALYRTVDGFDERFIGWGGEDRDFINRIEARTNVRRHPELLTHLHHERPRMCENREEIMTTITSASGGGTN
jgi:hypothetical protein